ncbi:oligo-1,6-glucosidase [Chryseomicrobium aureum]|uniref:alpha,alpha-phosphotrehalase n=1 Tax=Chryseomicrobium aureum TaxID=1441723 RepID=UPI0019581B2E|nr:oligo-1,6-glucosidase [Chryseomicrobium aureum]
MQQQPWWKTSVVYQIYPRSFMDSNGDGIGDIPGIISKLDYLQDLGIDVIWLSPVYDSPNDDNGYDIRDYRAIHKEFGTMADLEQLIEEAKKRGIRIVMDLVVNHTSDEHAWFTESKSSTDSPYRDYYIWKQGNPPNNWGSVFSGSAWERTEEDWHYLHLFSKKQPDLNWRSEALRKDVYDMMTYWLDKGIGGFRMDVINFISKHEDLPDGIVHEGSHYGDGSPYFMNGPVIHTYLQEMNEKVLKHYDILTVGEMPGATTDDAILYTKEDRHELNMVFTFEHMDLDSGPGGKWNYKDLYLPDLKRNFEKWQLALEHEGWNSLYWNNHDQPRIVSRFGNDEAYRVHSAKMLALVLHGLKGTPYIYQGEEIGMTNIQLPDISHYKDIETLNMYNERLAAGEEPESILKRIYVKGRDNARTPMQWTPQGGFTTGTPWLAQNPNTASINAEQAVNDPDSIFAFYKELIALRKKEAILTKGDFTLLLPDDEELFVYKRSYQGTEWYVLANFSQTTRTVAHEELPLPSTQHVIGNTKLKTSAHGIELGPYDAVIVECTKGEGK